MKSIEHAFPILQGLPKSANPSDMPAGRIIWGNTKMWNFKGPVWGYWRALAFIITNWLTQYYLRLPVQVDPFSATFTMIY